MYYIYLILVYRIFVPVVFDGCLSGEDGQTCGDFAPNFAVATGEIEILSARFLTFRASAVRLLQLLLAVFCWKCGVNHTCAVQCSARLLACHMQQMISSMHKSYIDTCAIADSDSILFIAECLIITVPIARPD